MINWQKFPYLAENPKGILFLILTLNSTYYWYYYNIKLVHVYIFIWNFYFILKESMNGRRLSLDLNKKVQFKHFVTLAAYLYMYNTTMNHFSSCSRIELPILVLLFFKYGLYGFKTISLNICSIYLQRKVSITAIL